MALLREIRADIAAGRTTEALDRIDNGAPIVAACSRKRLELTEEYFYEAGVAYLEFANGLPPSDQKAYREYAARARAKFVGYISWYDELTSDERKLLSPGNRRIQGATGLLGASVLRMENPEVLLSDYAEIPDAGYLGIDAMRIWKVWLYRCPEWRETPQTVAVRRKSICNSQCRPHWEAYADVLAEWAKTAHLRAAEKASRGREAQQIRQEADGCPTE